MSLLKRLARDGELKVERIHSTTIHSLALENTRGREKSKQKVTLCSAHKAIRMGKSALDRELKTSKKQEQTNKSEEKTTLWVYTVSDAKTRRTKQ